LNKHLALKKERKKENDEIYKAEEILRCVLDSFFLKMMLDDWDHLIQKN